MLRNKADINTIREILGHPSLNTTLIYTHLTIMDLKAVHKKCHLKTGRRVIACKKNKIDCGSFYLYQQDPATSG
ncbi:MAG: hypothetical protein KKE44_02360 [Proteobacteria bacterium]|nr:hypothetical protein [Pseudomonadota bacterium]MBU1581569.1 hypothetical protein [Pseudomonadota bacterium]MBU2453871.1 hypothetical protein [Pseudomonadota bacterium]